MFRRRRPNREIHFSFDSFLDVVANVVGIILRLILVVWVGARSYKAVVPTPPAPPVAALEQDLPDPRDPLSPELERERLELARLQASLLAQTKQWEKTHGQTSLTAQELARLTARYQQILGEESAASQKASEHSKKAGVAAMSIEEIRKRCQQVAEQIDRLNKMPVPTKKLRYRTPVSRPLQTEELLFECKHGHITLIDIGAFLDEIKKDENAKLERLRTCWELHETTPVIGAFRLHYTYERVRSQLEDLAPGGAPSSRAGFSAQLSGWEVDPVREPRGEPLEVALKPESEFRTIIDNLDPQETAITLWVYPDSFAIYRALRDYMHERDFVVAGRPLPEGSRIGSSRHGTVSRGQ
jgi:hypothetical protein